MCGKKLLVIKWLKLLIQITNEPPPKLGLQGRFPQETGKKEGEFTTGSQGGFGSNLCHATEEGRAQGRPKFPFS